MSYWQIERPIPLWIFIEGPSGDGVSGESPTAMVVRESDGKYADWQNHVWAMSGGIREQSLPESLYQPGFYLNTFDPKLWGDKDEEDYLVFYKNMGTYKRNSIEHFTTSHDVSIALLHNVMRNHMIATIDDPSRNINIGDLDKIIFKVKRQSDVDWTNPIYTGEVKLYNDLFAGNKYEKKSGGDE
jgi:hypothetical protein